ncbi:MAG: hypothetical protein ACFFBS_06385 [Promethearchaeota archaeon]
MGTVETKQIELSRVLHIVFIAASVFFFIFVSGIFLSSKLGYMALRGGFGALVIFLIAPYTVVLIWYLKKAEKPVIISLGIILFYLFLELTLDYILRIPFREILALHIFYIIVFYVAAFNMIGVSFRIDRKMGFIVTMAFWISLGCLIYMYLG